MIAISSPARQFPGLPLVFTGGPDGSGDHAAAEADIVERLLFYLGLSPGRVTFERRARNTREITSLVKPSLALKPADRILLVTSAFHLARATALFRAEGLSVVPFPVEFRVGDPAGRWRMSRALSSGLERSDLAVRARGGLAAARLLGHSRELFSAPQHVSEAHAGH